MNMKETMEQEIAEAIEAMTQANNALARIFGAAEEEGEEDMIQCTRCGASVEEQTLMKLGDALICEICWEDI